MATTITVRDETITGNSVSAFPVELLTERVTVRELIRSRVYQEVGDYNRRTPEYFRGLVQPTDAEQTLNGYKVRKARQLDWKAQFDKAIEAFQRNQFFILVDDKQVDELEDEVTLTPDTRVSFVKLVPLVGG
jgi:hypothetical protein